MDIEHMLQRADVIRQVDTNEGKLVFLSKNKEAPLGEGEKDIIRSMMRSQGMDVNLIEFRIAE